MNKKNYCNQADCPNGINCLDIRPEEVAIAALELLSRQMYEPPAYKGILGYKIETDKQEGTNFDPLISGSLLKITAIGDLPWTDGSHWG